MQERKFLVYKHTSPDGKVYIGITSKTLIERSGVNGIHYKNNKHFYNAIEKYGWDNFKHEILCDNLSKEEASEKESYYIKLFKSNDRIFGYNNTSGGEVHYELTEEIINKISNKAREQWKNPEIRAKMIESLKTSHRGKFTQKQKDAAYKRRGIPLSNETRYKISQSNKGKVGHPMSPELKEKFRKINKGRIPWNKGKTYSEEERKVISLKTKEGMNSPEVRKKIIEANKRRTGKTYRYLVYQYSLDYKLLGVYEGTANASRSTGINKSGIANCIYNKTKTSGGFIWRKEPIETERGELNG